MFLSINCLFSRVCEVEFRIDEKEKKPVGSQPVGFGGTEGGIEHIHVIVEAHDDGLVDPLASAPATGSGDVHQFRTDAGDLRGARDERRRRRRRGRVRDEQVVLLLLFLFVICFVFVMV